MKVLITGACGFVGSRLAECLLDSQPGVEITGIDNFIRPGSETNRLRLQKRGVRIQYADLRQASDLADLPAVDWVIDAAANPSVVAGVGGKSSTRQLYEHNLLGSLNILEYCRAVGAGILLLSSSRVYSTEALAAIPLQLAGTAFRPDESKPWPDGLSAAGLSVDFSTAPPISFYGSAKLASESMALEYGSAFDLPVWITRCGVLAGAGQFGVADQGIFSFWIHSHLRRRPLKYIGFGAKGYQVRDAMHPRDLTSLLLAQIRSGRGGGTRVYNAGGGVENAMSLAQLTEWCDERFEPHTVEAGEASRPYDIPWIVMDSAEAQREFNWKIEVPMDETLDEIARHAHSHPEWLDLCSNR